MVAIVFDLLLKPVLIQCLREATHDGAFVERLNKIIVRPEPHRLYADFHVIDTGSHQERYVRIAAANFFEQLNSANTWHIKIRNNRIEMFPLQRLESFFPVFCATAVKSRRAEN